MTEYVYHCRECNTTFNVEVEESEQGAPATTTCPKCASPDAMKAFSTEDTKPAGGGCGCAPGGSCC
jgi:putative FmdB family regulatory protein